MAAYAFDMNACASFHKASLPQLDGIFVLNKPAGPSSAQCIARIKRLGQKKIGHAGTLDPMADGVLLVLLGQATKISSWLMAGGVKVYNALARLGVETDTWDAEGNVLAEKDWRSVDPALIRGEVESWTSLAMQDVPAYSAAKHQGAPLYRLARAGMETPHKTKNVKIFKTDILSIDMPWIRFRVVCGSGVYIRSLAHSLGKRLGCGAALFGLTREHSHPFGLSEAYALSDVLANPELLSQGLKGIGSALPDWPQVTLSDEWVARARNGNPVPANGSYPGNTTAILRDSAGDVLALARLDWGVRGRVWTVMRGLWN